MADLSKGPEPCKHDQSVVVDRDYNIVFCRTCGWHPGLDELTALRAEVARLTQERDAALAGAAKVVPCGGCGATNPEDRCLGCFHPFNTVPDPDRLNAVIAATLERAARIVADCAKDARKNVAQCASECHPEDASMWSTIASYLEDANSSIRALATQPQTDALAKLIREAEIRGQVKAGGVFATSGAEDRWNEAQENACPACGGSGHKDDVSSGDPVTLTYRNWRGEVSDRVIIPRQVWFGSTEWHPEPQWLLTAWDAEKKAERDFALCDFIGKTDALAAVRREARAEGMRKLVDARRTTIEATKAYNDRLSVVNAERQRGFWLSSVGPEFQDMEDANRAFLATAQEVADAILAAAEKEAGE